MPGGGPLECEVEWRCGERVRRMIEWVAVAKRGVLSVAPGLGDVAFLYTYIYMYIHTY